YILVDSATSARQENKDMKTKGRDGGYERHAEEERGVTNARELHLRQRGRVVTTTAR
ncbi:hypothetical protein K523DRAFT_322498, partial [Schizophyllum commune Tattone D]